VDVPGLLLALILAGVEGSSVPVAVVEGGGDRVGRGLAPSLRGADLERVARFLLARAAEGAPGRSSDAPGRATVASELKRLVRAIRRRVGASRV
jgi:hypothetical protein